MKKVKFFFILLIVSILVITQFALASAAPSHDEVGTLSGTIDQVTQIKYSGSTPIYEITLTDDEGVQHTVRVSQDTAFELGLLTTDDDGNPILIDPTSEEWPGYVEIPLLDILPNEEEPKHPVGNALAVFFSGIDGVDYDKIMTAHEDGFGFGVIAQALWLIKGLDGNSADLTALLDAKISGDYSYFSDLFSEDETVPTNWGQFRKAVMAGDKKQNLGTVMSAKDPTQPGNNGNANNGNAKNNGSNDNKIKEKSNNGNNGNKDNNGKNKKP